jgi:hypothetical protein
MSEKDEIMPKSKARVEMTNGSRFARSGLRCVEAKTDEEICRKQEYQSMRQPAALPTRYHSCVTYCIILFVDRVQVPLPCC